MESTSQERYQPQLLTSGHEQLSDYTEQERKIIAACAPTDNQMIRELSMVALRAFAAKLHSRASARYGNSAKGDDNAGEQIKLLVEDLMRNPLLRVKEVSYIVDEGVSGTYDDEDVRHFSSSRFCKWIKIYLEEQKAVAMRKKAQIDHQSMTPRKLATDEIKAQHEAFFGELANRLEKGELPKNFTGFDAIYEECERLHVFDPLDLEEKRIIFAECKAYTGFEGAALVAFSRKVAYLCVLHQAAMVSYTLGELIRYVAGHDKNISGYLQDLAKTRLAEYAEYRTEIDNYITNNQHTNEPIPSSIPSA